MGGGQSITTKVCALGGAGPGPAAAVAIILVPPLSGYTCSRCPSHPPLITLLAEKDAEFAVAFLE